MNCALWRSGAPKKGEARVLYGIDREFPAVAVVNLGPDPQHQPQHYATENQLEECDTARENLRNAVAGTAVSDPFETHKTHKKKIIWIHPTDR